MNYLSLKTHFKTPDHQKLCVSNALDDEDAVSSEYEVINSSEDGNSDRENSCKFELCFIVNNSEPPNLVMPTLAFVHIV